MADLQRSFDALMNHRSLWRTALVISLIAIVILATLNPADPMPSLPSDKLNHLLAFVELTLLCRLSWPARPSWQFILPLLAFGLAIELVQANLPYRDFDLWDLATDGVGVALGLLPWPGLSRVRTGA